MCKTSPDSHGGKKEKHTSGRGSAFSYVIEVNHARDIKPHNGTARTGRGTADISELVSGRGTMSPLASLLLSVTQKSFISVKLHIRVYVGNAVTHCATSQKVAGMIPDGAI